MDDSIDTSKKAAQFIPPDLRPHSPIVFRAAMLAMQAHGIIGQTRMGSTDPYIYHPSRVATAVADAGLDDIAVAAAWVHDVVEDTQVTLSEIENALGRDVAEITRWLTIPPAAPGHPRAARKLAEREALAAAPYLVASIRYADTADNVSEMIHTDPGFARIYVPEKRLLLEAASQGHRGLHRAALAAVEAAECFLRDAPLTRRTRQP